MAREQHRKAGATFARIVHLDFKGLPLTPHSLCARLQTLRDAGATAVLLEWEDMLPFSDELADCASPHAYSAAEVAQVVQRAESLGLEVIPLVQTLGHLEFALKHERRADLREDPHDFGTLCPVSEIAAALVESLLTQVLALHPNATRVHIGCDEPQLGSHALTKAAARSDPDGLSGVLARHVTRTVGVARALGRTCLMWHDAAAGMGERCLARLLADGPQLVVWDYRAALQSSDAAPTFATRVLKLHAEGRSPPPLLATAYKGGDACDGVLPDEEARRGNQLAWRAWAAAAAAEAAAGGGGGGGEVAGVVLTGWSRFGHLMPLTEPLAAGMPSLLDGLASWSLPLHLGPRQLQGGGGCSAAAAAQEAAAEEAAAGAKAAAAVEEATRGAASLHGSAAGDDAALHRVCSQLQARHVVHVDMGMACTRPARMYCTVQAARRKLGALEEEWRTQTPPATARAPAPRLALRVADEAATLQQVLPSPPSSPSALLPLPSPHSHSLPQPMTLPLPPPNPASAVTPPARRNPQAGAARAGRTRHDPHGGGGLPRWRRCRVARRQSGRAAPARQAAGLRRGAPSPSVPSFGLQVCRLASGCVRVCLPIGGLRVRLLAWCRILLLLLPLLLLRIVGRHVAPGHEGV